MKKSGYSESQIIKILKEGESGMPVTDICREHGICRAIYYKLKLKYEGLIHPL
jgi:putative transposase